MSLVVAVAQLELEISAVAANRRKAFAAIDAASRQGVQLLVFPELTPTGYVFADAAEARALAEPVDGPTVTGWRNASAANSMVLVGGFCELGPDAEVYNSAVLIDRGQVRAVYRKAHLWGRESTVFRAGDERPPVVRTSVGRLGLLVCYDLEFPEWTRLAALEGAEILVAPVNWPATGVPAGERPIELVKAQAAAASNRMFVLVADRCGAERGVGWVGGSVIIDPNGYPIAGPPAESAPALLSATIDVAQARDKRLGRHNDVFADRRSELYR